MKRIVPTLAAMAIAAAATPAAAQALPDRPPLPDAELAQLRGGFQLPGGMTVTIGLSTVTRIDGREVLLSTFNIRDGLPRVGVLANRSGETGDRLSPVAVELNGAGVATADGVVRLRSTAGGVRVDLAGAGTDISHLLGQSLGSVIANSVNDRSIDVTTSIDIGVGGITPDALGSSMARVESLALDATTRLMH